MSPTAKPGIGFYLGVVQFFFALCWTVYVIFLPQLAAQVGIPKHAVIWVLMLDQFVFSLVDFMMGVASDRLAGVVGRVGHCVLGLTLVSCVAFVAMPYVAPQASPALFLAIVVLWSASSSALRAPPLTLIGRHAARPQQPWLVALSLLGLGLAGAVGPYLGVHLRSIDPRGPFVLSSLALALTTLGIVAAERSLARSPSPTDQTAPVAPGHTTVGPRVVAFLLAAGLAALGFQVHDSLNSGPLYLHLASPEEMPLLAPVFWIAFNLFMFPVSLATARCGALRVMGASGIVAAAAALAAHEANSLQVLVAAQFLAGVGWAGLLMSSFAAALELGHTGREGRYSGALSSVLAFAALLRMAVLALGWNKDGPVLLLWLPPAAWLLAGGLMLAMSRRRALS